VLNGQLTFLDACLANEIMSSTRKHTCEDLLTL
jgi:hypothetical protein